MLFRPLFALLALVAAPLLAAPEKEVVREQRSVRIGGTEEVWRLVWRGPPREAASCGPADPSGAMTCPCSGAAYAQVGDLVLERQRPGTPRERLPLTPLFAGSNMLFNEKGAVAMLQRWPTRLDDMGDETPAATIRARAPAPVLRLRDYNHDGIAGEFLLQIDTLPCGKHLMVAIGTTRDHPRLHALTSAEHPERPLKLYSWQWEALARNPQPGEVMDWPCDDHGAAEETTVRLRAEHGRLHATALTKTCPSQISAPSRRPFVKKVLKREAL
jgi:hypothetical protein